jgi:hypothetical protein
LVKLLEFEIVDEEELLILVLKLLFVFKILMFRMAKIFIHHFINFVFDIKLLVINIFFPLSIIESVLFNFIKFIWFIQY